jgi:hypothetical protein
MDNKEIIALLEDLKKASINSVNRCYSHNIADRQFYYGQLDVINKLLYVLDDQVMGIKIKKL